MAKTISDVREVPALFKRMLEKSLFSQLSAFEDASGLEVHSITVLRDDTSTIQSTARSSSLTSVTVEVRVSGRQR